MQLQTLADLKRRRRIRRRRLLPQQYQILNNLKVRYENRSKYTHKIDVAVELASSVDGILADAHEIRKLGRGIFRYGQTNPPTKTVPDLFPNGNYPIGEIMDYKDE